MIIFLIFGFWCFNKFFLDAKELLVKYKQLAEEYNKVVRDSQILKKAILLVFFRSISISILLSADIILHITYF